MINSSFNVIGRLTLSDFITSDEFEKGPAAWKDYKVVKIIQYDIREMKY